MIRVFAACTSQASCHSLSHSVSLTVANPILLLLRNHKKSSSLAITNGCDKLLTGIKVLFDSVLYLVYQSEESLSSSTSGNHSTHAKYFVTFPEICPVK